MLRTDLAGIVRTPVFRTMPAGGKSLPILLVGSEIFAVRERIAGVARRFRLRANGVA